MAHRSSARISGDFIQVNRWLVGELEHLLAEDRHLARCVAPATGG